MTQDIVHPDKLEAVQLLSPEQVSSPGILFSGETLVLAVFPSGECVKLVSFCTLLACGRANQTLPDPSQHEPACAFPGMILQVFFQR